MPPKPQSNPSQGLNHENNTLLFFNRERITALRNILIERGHRLDVPDDELSDYLSRKSDGFDEIELLASEPQELMPDNLARREKDILYYLISDPEKQAKRMKVLTAPRVSGKHAIGSIRASLLTLFSPSSDIARNIHQTMTEILRRRAGILALELETPKTPPLQLPPKWMLKISEDIADRYFSDRVDRGRQNPFVVDTVSNLDYLPLSVRRKMSPKDLEDADLISRMSANARRKDLAAFFGRTPDPKVYAGRMLDISSLCKLLNSRGKPHELAS